jgi:hypothetical protein
MSNCKTIRTQLEETSLGDSYSQPVRAHLLQCDACRQFEKEQKSLRELVGSLGTVQAPADFDFKLRARMANASPARNGGVRFLLSPVVASVVIVLFVGVIASIGYINKRPPTDIGAQNNPGPRPVQIQSPARNPEHSVAVLPTESKGEGTRGEGIKSKRISGVGSLASYKPKRQMAVTDSSSTVAPTYGTTTRPSASRVFPIDASLNSVKVSLDDGQGNARTISLPGISFGSQRVVGNQFSQKGVW